MSAEGKRNRTEQGRYRREMPCDCCGKPVYAEHFTDGEVCGDTDDPGFYLCGRVRCEKRLHGLTVEQRRDLYTRQRAENETADTEGRRPTTMKGAQS